MRDAEVPFELVEQYCQAILSAETEEEVEMIKQEMPISLANAGLDETTIKNFFIEVNMLTERIEEGKLTINEEGNIKKTKNTVEVNTELGNPADFKDIIPNNQEQKIGGVVASVVTTALVGALLLKTKILNKKQTKDDHLSR